MIDTAKKEMYQNKLEAGHIMIQERFGKYSGTSVPAAKRDQQKVVKELKLTNFL